MREVVPLVNRGDDPHVRPAFDHPLSHLATRNGLHDELYPRVGVAKGGEKRWQREDGSRRTGGQRHAPGHPRAHLSHRRLTFLQQRQGPADERVEPLTGRRQRHPASLPLEQSLAYLTLEGLDLLSDCRLAEVES